MVRASACHVEGCGFKSRQSRTYWYNFKLSTVSRFKYAYICSCFRCFTEKSLLTDLFHSSDILFVRCLFCKERLYLLDFLR
jgi:hypothetical protein